jgi:hypothetical protein
VISRLKENVMVKRIVLAGVLSACLLPGLAGAQQLPTDAEEEKMDAALRKFGYVTGQAFACHTKDQQTKLEKTALDVATNVLRLFGSDRAFFYAAAFGAGAAEVVDQAKCPAIVKQAEEMVGKMKVLSTR